MFLSIEPSTIDASVFFVQRSHTWHGEIPMQSLLVGTSNTARFIDDTDTDILTEKTFLFWKKYHLAKPLHVRENLTATPTKIRLFSN